MSKLPLTDRQKEVLRVVSAGLRDGSIKTSWGYSPVISRDRIILFGFPRAAEAGMKSDDMPVFERFGFIQRSIGDSFTVFEQRIFDAVDSNFEEENPASSGFTQNVTIHNLSGSAVNIGTQLSNIRQVVGEMKGLDLSRKQQLDALLLELRQELSQLEQTNPTEAKRVAKAVGRVIDDVSDEEPDREGIQISLEGLQKAAQNLTEIAPKVFSLASVFIEFVRRIGY